MSLLPEHRHSHLRLAAALTPGVRRPRPVVVPRRSRYADPTGHAAAVHDDIMRVRAEHQARVATLGVDPELVLVLETNRQISADDVRRAGLTVLELRSEAMLIAFAGDSDMNEFLARNAKYQLGSPGTTSSGAERAAAHEDLFDGIDRIRRLRPTDVLSEALFQLIASVGPRDVIRLDIQCWCGEDESEARRRNGDVQASVSAAGGMVRDHGVRVEAGWSTVCADVPAGRITELVAVDRVRWVDLLPQPVLNYPALRATSPSDLPMVLAPAADAPLLAVVDSGVRSAHPLLSPAVVGAEWIGPGLGDGGDEAGHGTLVASLALYGSLEEALADRAQPMRPAGRLLSVRVLNRTLQFPSERSWERQLMEALQMAADAGARVVNLSLGDPRCPYLPPRPTPVAALVDLFIRENPTIVVVVSAGNSPLAGFTSDSLLQGTYVRTLLDEPTTGLLDPATAALALTVGGLCADHGQGALSRVTADVKPVGSPGLPSPWTRVGPGVARMIKPELSAPAGSATVDTLSGRVRSDDPATSVVGAGGVEQSRLLALGVGTSLAAPLVSHAALRVVGQYPALSANAVRALLLLSSEPARSVMRDDPSARAQQEQRRLTGYGRVSVERAVASTDSRAVLVAEGTIRLDDVHLYLVPMPATFFDRGGWRRVSIALAYDPPVRATRLDYLASRMGVNVFFGASLETVRRAYVVADRGDEEATPSELEGYKLALQPSDSERGRGTHQFASFDRQIAFDRQRGTELVVAVRNVRKWDTPGVRQPYALAVALERDQDHAGLYAELRAQLDALVAIELEGELEM